MEEHVCRAIRRRCGREGGGQRRRRGDRGRRNGEIRVEKSETEERRDKGMREEERRRGEGRKAGERRGEKRRRRG